MGGGGASGSSGVPSNTSGQAVSYQPTAQPQSDALYQALLGGFAGSLSPGIAVQFSNTFGTSPTGNPFDTTPGGVSYGVAAPFIGGQGSNTITDPYSQYYEQAQSGAQSAAGLSPLLFGAGSNLAGFGNALATPGYLDQAFNASQATAASVAPQISSLGGQLSGLANALVTPQTNNAIANQTILDSLANNQLIPGVENAYNMGQQSLSPAYSLLGAIGGSIPSVTGGALAGSNALNQYGNQILGTAFDPQGALYNQLQNQVAQQANAAAASAGLGGSAYGASNTSNALGNFNINWQNQQLARQAQGLSAAEPAFSTAAGLPGSAISSLGSALGTTTGAALSPYTTESNLASQLGNIYQGAALLPGNVQSQYGSLGSQAAALDASAIGLPYSPYTGASTAGSGLASLIGAGGQLGSAGASLTGLPQSTQASDVSNALAALGSYTNIGNQQYTIPQQLANDLQSYLQLGQAASGLSGQLGALGLNEQQSSLAGIGSALGAGSNLLFGNQGLSGALGLGSSGLLGSLGGGASSLGALSGSTAGNVALDTAAVDTGAIDSGLAGGAGAATGGGFSLGSLIPFGAS